MPFVDINSLGVVERLPGWSGRHFHAQEEVWEVTEGELDVTIDGAAQVARPGMVAIVPGGVRHSARALTDGRAIIVDYPLRRDFD